MGLQEELRTLQPVVMDLFTQSVASNRLSHGYLFAGARGTGKKQMALWLAKSLFCLEQTKESLVCGKCVNCTRIENHNHPDVHFLKPDGLSIKIDQVRELKMELTKRGMESDKKVLIIEEADKMTLQSANSLLKFIEEPEPGMLLLFLTENQSQILPTIASRLQPVQFKELNFNQLVERLVATGIAEQKARIYASLTGSIDEAMHFEEDEFFADARSAAVKLYEGLYHSGPNPLIFIQETWMPLFKEKENLKIGLDLFMLLLRDVLHMALSPEYQLICVGQKDMLKNDALKFSLTKITRDIELILSSKTKLDSNMNPQLLMEQLVLKVQGGHSID
ncbi:MULTISPECIES: DNA polymerase III subunit delta' [unclassified Listeria]|uniref:DNA polymerase III subunit delta' n=1 Tax=unclassified Listeria TaxID=2642072 RepID=UPI000B597F2F|nr:MULTISPECIES: DNA polymerase III subunit delta' [unclassified Listeria]